MITSAKKDGLECKIDFSNEFDGPKIKPLKSYTATVANR
jgi:hypothetical protein